MSDENQAQEQKKKYTVACIDSPTKISRRYEFLKYNNNAATQRVRIHTKDDCHVEEVYFLEIKALAPNFDILGSLEFGFVPEAENLSDKPSEWYNIGNPYDSVSKLEEDFYALEKNVRNSYISGKDLVFNCFPDNRLEIREE